jgi:hypothetical protein
VASALLELAELETDPNNRVRYREEAVATLTSLASPAYLASAQPTLGLLLHGVGNLPANQEIDVSLIYGDYFFIEAVSRFLRGAELFSDDFNRSGALGSSWIVQRGAFSTTGSAAISTAAQSYAFWTGSPPADGTVSATLATPLRSTYVGVTARAATDAPDRDHYAAYVTPNGRLQLARRTWWVYSYLADGPAFPSGSHVLSLTTEGINPVILRVSLDGTEVMRFSDASAEALRVAGRSGIFDYNGAAQPIDRFQVLGPD